MIDTFSILLSHGLMLLAAWRLIGMDALDREPEPAPPAEDADAPAKDAAMTPRRGKPFDA